MLKISSFAPNFPKMGGLAPNFAFLDDTFPTKTHKKTTRKFSDNFPTAKNLWRGNCFPCHDATGCVGFIYWSAAIYDFVFR